MKLFCNCKHDCLNDDIYKNCEECGGMFFKSKVQTVSVGFCCNKTPDTTRWVAADMYKLYYCIHDKKPYDLEIHLEDGKKEYYKKTPESYTKIKL